MGTNHDGCVRGFNHYRAAWYGKVGNIGRDVVDEINIGMYHPEGGTTGEFSIKWEELSGAVVARLNVYDDAWNALGLFGDVLAAMAALDGKVITPEAFCDVLTNCGLADLTARDAPQSVKESRAAADITAAAPEMFSALKIIAAGHPCPSAIAEDALMRAGVAP